MPAPLSPRLVQCPPTHRDPLSLCRGMFQTDPHRLFKEVVGSAISL